jgi:signal transduction histidine kinase
LVDAGVALAVLVAAEIAIATAHEAGSHPRDWLAYVLGVAMALPLLLRRRAPLATLYLVSAVLLVFYALGYPGFPPSLLLAVPLYDVARAGYVWRAVPVPAAFLSAGYLVAVRRGTPPLDAIALFLPEIALAAVAILVGALVHSRREYAAEVRLRLRMVEAEREREAERRVNQERLRIARELHDTVAHAIATITVQAGAALHVAGREPERATEALTSIRRTGKTALAEMSTVLHILRGESPAPPGNSGLDRLPDLLTAVREAGLDVALGGDPDGGRLAATTDHAAYRILQEALTNVLRHAGSSAHAQVLLTWSSQWLTLEVCDDGDGADGSAERGGHGLTGMRERAVTVGGRLEAGPRSEGGFRVWARLPREAG